MLRRLLQRRAWPRGQKPFDDDDPRPRLAIGVSVFDWAFDIKARQIARVLTDWQVRISDRECQPAVQADVLVSLWWLDLPYLRRLVEAPRALLGVYSHSCWRLQPQAFAEACKLADGILAANETLKEELGEFTDLPIYVCPDTVDMGLFPLQPYPDRWTLGWCGSDYTDCFADDYKGVNLLRLAAAQENVPFMVQPFQKRIPHERMAKDFYAGISAYACASIAEGGPNPVLEALSCGRPIITTPVGAAKDVVRPGETGLFIERKGPSVRAAIRELRTWPLNGELAARCRASLTSTWTDPGPAWRAALTRTP